MSSSALRKQAQSVFRRLKRAHPDAKCELNYQNALELLVATILSAQCTDARVNEVTAELFKRCKKPADYLKLSATELQKIIHSTGFFRQKAKSIQGTAKRIIDEHQGQVPQEMESLRALPGVGRKTANVVLGNAFGIPGLPVDTHVTRLSNRIGLTRQQDAIKIEADLCALLSPKNWTLFSHLLIFHGRRVCKARKPLCEECALAEICNFNQGLR